MKAVTIPMTEMEKSTQTVATESSSSESATHREYVVDFALHETLDPLNWSEKYKWSIVLLLSLLSAFV